MAGIKEQFLDLRSTVQRYELGIKLLVHVLDGVVQQDDDLIDVG